MSGCVTNKNKKIKVWARFRPTSCFSHDSLELLPDKKSIAVHHSSDGRAGDVVQHWIFKLDGYFYDAAQEDVFNTLVSDLLVSTVDGFNATLLCYGQTGAGKTFTITGASQVYEKRGMIPRALYQLFREIKKRSESRTEVSISYLEIYDDTLRDLLTTAQSVPCAPDSQPVALTENKDGVHIKGLSTHPVHNEEEALSLLFEGDGNRVVTAHSLNSRSSRSHCIFTVSIESRPRVVQSPMYTCSKLTFVDLAGSERTVHAQCRSQLMKETMYANKSQTFLGQMMMGQRGQASVRQCKLTHYLRNCIGGNCNTVVIANLWGEQEHLQETVNSLRFATQFMGMYSEPTVNEKCDQAACCFCQASKEHLYLLEEMEKELKQLQAQQAVYDTILPRSMSTTDALVAEQEKNELKMYCQNFLDGELEDVDLIRLKQIQGAFDAIKEICRQKETEVEEKLRKKFNLASADEESAAATEDPQAKRGQRSKSGLQPKSGRGSPALQLKTKELRVKKKIRKISMKAAAEQVEEEQDSASQTSQSTPDLQQPSEPSTGTPDRAALFEEFKQRSGFEMYRALIENKEVLYSVKKKYSDLAKRINSTKKSIDSTRLNLHDLQAKRHALGQGYNDDGDIIVEEEEYTAIKKLKELKASYHRDFKSLSVMRNKVQYCHNLVHLARQQLLSEFDRWYEESFSSTEKRQIKLTVSPLLSSVGTGDEDEFERRRAELFRGNPEYLAFNTARNRAQQHRVYLSAMAQPQPSYRRHMGLPTITMCSKLPSVLQAQHSD